jgi:AcrR family transcriptional regulator
MSKGMIKPGPELLQRVTQAFLDYGYSGLSMVTMAKACGFTQRALYYYFSNKVRKVESHFRCPSRP